MDSTGVVPSHNRMIILSWIPRLTSSLSCVGSLAIVYMIIIDHKHKLAKPKNRLILALSIFDILHSSAYVVTTLAYPRESMVYGAIGNACTCTAQGFFLLLGLAVPMYSASLSLLYALTIRYGMRLVYFSHNIEPLCHILSVLVPLAIATTSAIMDDIRWGYKSPVCFISLASRMKWPVAVIVPLCFLVNLCSMILICSHVYAQSNKMKKYSYGVAQRQRRKSQIKKTVQQALLYMLAFFITFLFPLITLMVKRYYYAIEVLMNICYPLQGFWNFLLYIRKGISDAKKMTPDRCLLGLMCNVIFYSKVRNTRTRQNRWTNEDMGPIQTSLAIPDFNDGTEVEGTGKCEETKEEITSDNIAVKFSKCADNKPANVKRFSLVLFPNSPNSSGE